MEPESHEQIKPCPRCGKIRTERGGSITQWISSCNCAESVTIEHEAPSSTICQTCGKRQTTGRSGSFTQWVFRQDLCTCNQPGFAGGANPASKTSVVQDGANIYRKEEKELEVNPQKFPLERYKPLAELGRGAAGTVYLCRDRLLGTKMAVKVLNVLTSEKLVAFQNEAKATSRLSHKNIVKILDFGATASGYPYMVMERFLGESLENYLKEHGTLSPSLATAIFTEVAGGLEYAHERGIFHRDIKPSNILLKFDDRSGHPTVMIIDFGVAQLEASSQEPTIVQGRTMVGTPHYMSPDQANNLPYDERSEVYSLGCVMFEALSGQPPFNGDTPLEIIGKHANEMPPKLQEIVGDNVVPASLEAAVDRALAKEPDDRIQNMTDLKKELARTLQQETRTGFYNASEKRPTSTGLIVASSVALVVMALLGISTWQSQIPAKPENQTTSKKRSSERNPISAKAHFEKLLTGSGPEFEKLLTRSSPKHWEIKNGVWSGDTFITDSDLKILRGKFVSQLFLRDSRVTNQGIAALADMKLPLILLDVTNSKIDDGLAPYLVKFPNLRNLYLSRTKITDKGIEAMTGIPALNRLELDTCAITDRAADIIVKRWPEIENLDISSNKVTTRSFKRIAKLKNLHHLMVANLKLSDRDMDLITSLPLRTVDFTESDFGTIENLKKIARLKQLETAELSLAKPNITRALQRWLEEQLPKCALRLNAQLENEMDTSSDMQPPIEFLGE